MTAGYSGTPLPKKLGIRPGSRVAVMHDPGHADELLADVPAGATVVYDPSVPPTARRDAPDAFDVVVCFVPRAADLDARVGRAARLIRWDGGLWISWPKMKSPLFVDLREGEVRGRGLAEGLVDNKICAVDEDWSGLRFVVRREDRPRPRPGRR